MALRTTVFMREMEPVNQESVRAVERVSPSSSKAKQQNTQADAQQAAREMRAQSRSHLESANNPFEAAAGQQQQQAAQYAASIPWAMGYPYAAPMPSYPQPSPYASQPYAPQYPIYAYPAQMPLVPLQMPQMPMAQPGFYQDFAQQYGQYQNHPMAKAAQAWQHLNPIPMIAGTLKRKVFGLSYPALGEQGPKPKALSNDTWQKLRNAQEALQHNWQLEKSLKSQPSSQERNSRNGLDDLFPGDSAFGESEVSRTRQPAVQEHIKSSFDLYGAPDEEGDASVSKQSTAPQADPKHSLKEQVSISSQANFDYAYVDQAHAPLQQHPYACIINQDNKADATNNSVSSPSTLDDFNDDLDDDDDLFNLDDLLADSAGWKPRTSNIASVRADFGAVLKRPAQPKNNSLFGKALGFVKKCINPEVMLPDTPIRTSLLSANALRSQQPKQTFQGHAPQKHAQAAAGENNTYEMWRQYKLSEAKMQQQKKVMQDLLSVESAFDEEKLSYCYLPELPEFDYPAEENDGPSEAHLQAMAEDLGLNTENTEIKSDSQILFSMPYIDAQADLLAKAAEKLEAALRESPLESEAEQDLEQLEKIERDIVQLKTALKASKANADLSENVSLVNEIAELFQMMQSVVSFETITNTNDSANTEIEVSNEHGFNQVNVSESGDTPMLMMKSRQVNELLNESFATDDVIEPQGFKPQPVFTITPATLSQVIPSTAQQPALVQGAFVAKIPSKAKSSSLVADTSTCPDLLVNAILSDLASDEEVLAGLFTNNHGISPADLRAEACPQFGSEPEVEDSKAPAVTAVLAIDLVTGELKTETAAMALVVPPKAEKPAQSNKTDKETAEKKEEDFTFQSMLHNNRILSNSISSLADRYFERSAQEDAEREVLY